MSETVSDVIAGLLDDLESLNHRYPELEDTYMREQLADILKRGFIDLEPGFEIPERLGMYSPLADAELRLALERFIVRQRRAHPNNYTVATKRHLLAPLERFIGRYPETVAAEETVRG